MSTIQELEQKVEQLEKDILAKNQKLSLLTRQAEKAIDYATHAYRVDHYGFIWVYNAETKLYNKTEMRLHTPEVPDKSIGERELQDGAVTEKKLAPNAITPDKIKPGTFDGKYLFAYVNLVGVYMEENGDIVAEIDETNIPGEFVPVRKVTSEDIEDETIQEEDLDPELMQRLDNGPDATDEDIEQIVNY